MLRPLRESDLDAVGAIYADPHTMRFLGGPRTRDNTRTRLEWMIAAHRDQGFGLWATTLLEDATLIGRCGILIQDVEGAREQRDRLPARVGVVGAAATRRRPPPRSATTPGRSWASTV